MSHETKPTQVQDYFNHGALSASMLNVFRRSRKLYWAKYIQRSMPANPTTPTLELGTACHIAVLEPDTLNGRVTVAPNVDRRTKAGRQQWAEFQEANRNLTILTPEQWETVQAVQDAVRRSPLPLRLFKAEGPVETPIYFIDKDEWVECRALPDKWVPGEGVVVDLKTTSDVSPHGFSRSITKYQYHIQAAHYLEATGGTRFVWVVVETTPPFEVRTYELDPESLARAKAIRAATIQEIRECETSGNWGQICNQIETLQLPSWVS